MQPSRKTSLTLLFVTICIFVGLDWLDPQSAKEEKKQEDRFAFSTRSIDANKTRESSELVASEDLSSTDFWKSKINFNADFTVSEERKNEKLTSGSQGRTAIIRIPGTRWPIRVEHYENESGHERTEIMVSNQLLLQLNKESSEDELLELIETFGGTIVRETSIDPNAYQVSIKSGTSSQLPELIESLNSLPGIVSHAEPNYIIRALRTPNDPYYDQQWALEDSSRNPNRLSADINAEQGWDIQRTAASQIVAVIDSGIQLSNRDIIDNLWENPNEIVNGVDDDNNGYIDDQYGINLLNSSSPPNDTNGHGTAVAGLIGAKGNNQFGISGVAWDIQLMPIRFLDNNNLGSTADAITSINYAVKNGAKIINASWGSTSKSELLKTALANASVSNVLVVSAAGNDSKNLNSSPVYPASYDLSNILVVGSINRDAEKSVFSNYSNSIVDISAPGEEVISLSIKDGKDTELYDGTSFSAPIVSGIAAIAREHFDLISPEQIINQILFTARIPNQAPYDWVKSRGVADLNRVLKNAQNIPVNDNFSNATPIETTATTVFGTTFYATVQDTEPISNNQDKSVWYSFIPDFPQAFTISSDNLRAGENLHIYKGTSLENLEEIGIYNNIFDTEKLLVPSNQDNLLYIQISSSAPVWFELALEVPPVNDDFDLAIPIELKNFDIETDNYFASTQTDEPAPWNYVSKSVWWSFVSTNSGGIRFSTIGTDFDSRLAVYTGTSIESLTLIESNDDANDTTTSSEVQFEAQPNTKYYIQVDSKFSTDGKIRLSGGYLRELSFLAQPLNISLPLGSQTVFSGLAIGPTSIDYQWFFNGAPITGAIQRTLTVNNISAADLGDYALRATTSGKTIMSSSATLSELGTLPYFVLEPLNTDVIVKERLTLRAKARGTGNVSLQWFKNGTAIPGATNSVYEVNSALISHSGDYSVKATSEQGSVFSRGANVLVASQNDFLQRKLAPDSYSEIIGITYSDETPVIHASLDGKLYSSKDGLNWTEVLAYVDGKYVGGDIYQITYGNGIYLVNHRSQIAAGTTLEDLSTYRPIDPSPITLLGFFGNRFYANANTGGLAYSFNGYSWESFPDIFSVTKLVEGKGQNELGALSLSNFYYTADGDSWNSLEMPIDFVRSTGLIHDGNKFVLVSTNGEIISTTNGANWIKETNIPISNSESCSDIGFSNGQYFVSGVHGLYVSSNLKNWQRYDNLIGYNESIYSTNGLIIGESPNGEILRIGEFSPIAYSPVIERIAFKKYYISSPGDELRFEVEVEEMGYSVASISYYVDGVLEHQGKTFDWKVFEAGDYHVVVKAVDNFGYIATESSTISVRENRVRDLISPQTPISVLSVNNAFGKTFAVTENGTLFEASDIDSWKAIHYFPTTSVRKVFFHNNRLFVVTIESLYMSQNGIKWELASTGSYSYYSSGSWIIRISEETENESIGFSIDGETWLENSYNFSDIIGTANGAVIGKTNSDSSEIQVALPGQSLQTFNLPSSGIPTNIFEDEGWGYLVLSENDRNTAYTDRLYRTKDFSNWELIDLDGIFQNRIQREIDDVQYSNGVYYTSTDNGTYVSIDLIDWTELEVDSIQSLTEFNGSFYLLADGWIYRSEDTLSWAKISQSSHAYLQGTNRGIYSWRDTSWSAHSFSGSKDGENWQVLSKYDSNGPYFSDVAYGNGLYVATGEKYATSTDLVGWTEIDLPEYMGSSIAFGNDRFVCVASGRTNLSAGYSLDGKTWNYTDLDITITKNGNVAFLPGENVFILEPQYALPYFTSSDGISWKEHPYVGDDLEIIGNLAVMKRRISENGVDWKQTSFTPEFYFNGLYYSGKSSSFLHSSPNGIDWELIGQPSLSKIEDFFLIEGKMVIRYKSNSLSSDYYISSDGYNWESFFMPELFGNKVTTNEHTFFLTTTIKTLAKVDLAVEEVTLLNKKSTYLVNDELELSVKINNPTSSEISFESLDLYSRLVTIPNSDFENDHELSTSFLQGIHLVAGESRSFTTKIVIPRGTKPGTYRLEIQLNAKQSLLESTLANNFASINSHEIYIPSKSLTINTNEGGSAIVTPNREEFAQNDTVTISVIPNSKFHIESVSGVPPSELGVYSLEMDDNKTVEITFAKNTYTVELFSEGNGLLNQIKWEPYEYGETVKVTAVPDTGWVFIEWVGDIISKDPELEFSINSDVVATAKFAESYESWIKRYIDSSTLGSDGLQSEDANSDNDLYSNILEYTLGTNPALIETEPPFSITIEGKFAVLNYSQNKFSIGKQITIQGSENGEIWIDIMEEATLVSEQDSTIIKRIEIPLRDQGTNLFRLSVSPQD